MEDNKYIVFKRDQWEAHKDQSGCMPENLAVADAVVIRRQDVFAPPALDAYANAILVSLQMNGLLGEDAQRLQTIADYFHGQAVEAWNTKRKIPD